jgi:hypothetical protein
MPTIQYLRLDNSNDVIWVAQSALADVDAVAQAILTRLRLYQNEWWENLNLGIPLFQEIIGGSGSKAHQAIISLAYTQQILGTPYVSGVSNTSTTFDSVTRQFTYNATVSTAFGPVKIQFIPGSAGTVVN